MNCERWKQVEHLYNSALELAAEGRASFLAAACAGDDDLRREVLSLISSAESADGFLEEPLVGLGLALMGGEGESLVGEMVGPYELIGLLGRGGMGDVYLALDRRLGRNVALKLLPDGFVNSPGWVSRFGREARSASSITHPNVAHVYDVDEVGGRRYISMEYVEGVTLRDRLKDGPLSPAEAADIALQIARALAAAHSAGVLHRDIKPDNVMIRRDGYVKVLDFGLAKAIPGRGEVRGPQSLVSAFDTEPGMIMGSPAYMSPEQARGRDVDPRSDLWSLGVVLYELVTGRNPFLSETPSDTLAAILKTDPPPPTSLAPDAPAEVDRIVARLLSKSPGARYQTAESLIEDLSRAAGRPEFLSAPARPAVARAAPAKSGGGPPRRRAAAREATATGRLLAALSSAPAHIRGAAGPLGLSLSVLALLAAAVTVAVKYAADPSPGAQEPPITSVAVLPFANDGSDPDLDYLPDGLSEQLIEQLSRQPGLKVIARGSSFKYKGDRARAREAARELGVQAVVMGSVAVEGEDLRVHVEVVDARHDRSLWSGEYYYKRTDLPAAPYDISRLIVDRLNPDLAADEAGQAARGPAPSGVAYEKYLKGRYYWNQLTEEALDRSIEHFSEAVAASPDFALAHAGLANSYNTLGGNYRSPAQTFPKAEQHARRALALDDSLAEAHYAVAVSLYLYRWDMDGAERELRRTLELNPNFAPANSLLCSLSLTRGEVGEATDYINRALEVDPFSLLFNVHLSYIYYCQRDGERAVRQFQHVLRQNPEAGFVYSDLAKAYAQMGRFDDALAASQRATILMGQEPHTLSSLGVVYALSGKTDDARWVAEALEKLSERKHVQAYFIASIYGALGDRDRAFDWLEKAGRQQSPHMLRIRVDPVFDRLRPDPRYQELLRAVRLG